jgi:hypothetical protein
MELLYNWSWVESQITHTIEVWNGSAASPAQTGPRYSPQEQRKGEAAYDQGLQAVEREARRAPRSKAERLRTRNRTQDRITTAFARFSAIALDLEDEAIQLLTDDFLPVGTKLASWARDFDPDLSRADIIQACRNAWTACGLQPLFGEPLQITPSILGYSLLYPYSDNYLDRADIPTAAKLHFSRRFRQRLHGEHLPAQNSREAALWTLVHLIEAEYPRLRYPQVFDCLLAIHRAQEQSIAQLRTCADCDSLELLRMSCAKGGSSVLADACLARGWLSEEESRFAFEWGALLQLGDDLQDVQEDIQRGSVTLFSLAAAAGKPLDSLVRQLLGFSERVADRMGNLPGGTRVLKQLLRMSWRSLIIEAVAESHEFFSPEFLQEVERCSPFRFAFLRARRRRLTGRQGLYEMLFDVFLEAEEDDHCALPLADHRQALRPRADFEPVADFGSVARRAPFSRAGAKRVSLDA